MIDPPRKAPAFTLRDQDGEARALADYAGAPVVVYFYPKDDTETCTKQACAFRDALPDFGRLGCAVLGVSPQDVASKAKFAGKHGLRFPILADPVGKDGTPRVCGKYGVWREKSMYGNTYMGVVRTTYLIDARGRVARRWDNVRLKGHLEQVLETIRGLEP